MLQVTIVNWFGVIVSDICRYIKLYILGRQDHYLFLQLCKKGIYRAFNAVFRKIGRVASSDVVVQLVKTKCLPVLYYAIEVCPTNKSDVLSLQYVIDTCFRKIFNVKSKDVVQECETEFGVFQSLTLLT